MAVANELLALAKERGFPVSPMKLQKLLYFAHGWHLALRGKPLIKESVEAWRFGPVIRSVYRAFKSYGGHDIPGPGLTGLIPTGGGLQPFYERVPAEDSDVLALLRKIVDVYGGMAAIELSRLTHRAGTPWRQAIDAAGGRLLMGVGIPDATIQAHFKALTVEHTP
jgi:uncharacterized phage-associated protein